MGQQQLLLLVVGIILVAVAVTIGITQFGNSIEDGVKDSVVLQLNYIGNKAIQYYMKPLSLAGGGNSFTDFAIPGTLENSPDGGFTITTPGDQSITITGAPNASYQYLWTATATVTIAGGVVVVIN